MCKTLSNGYGREWAYSMYKYKRLRSCAQRTNRSASLVVQKAQSLDSGVDVDLCHCITKWLHAHDSREKGIIVSLTLQWIGGPVRSGFEDRRRAGGLGPERAFYTDIRSSGAAT